MPRQALSLCIVIVGSLLARPADASSSNPTANMNVTVDSVVRQRDDNQPTRAEYRGEGTVESQPNAMTIQTPSVNKVGSEGNTYGVLKIDTSTLMYRTAEKHYIGNGTASVLIAGDWLHFDTLLKVRIQQSANGLALRGSMTGRTGDATISSTIRGSSGAAPQVEPNTGGVSKADKLDLTLPVKPMKWKDVPARFRPPNPKNIAQVISVDHPKLAEKLADTSRDGWLIVRGNKPFPLGEFDFAGWVKIECPRLNPAWSYNSIRGIGGDDRIWLEGVEVVGPGDSTLFQGVEYVYTDRCLFRNIGHVIVDTANWDTLDGCVMNTEFRKNYHDPFSYFAGAVVNVAVTSTAYLPSAHVDMLQAHDARNLYWKHVWNGTPKNPALIMGIRGSSIRDSYFEDVRHYQYPGTGHTSLNIPDARGTVFKDCVFTGELRVQGATFK